MANIHLLLQLIIFKKMKTNENIYKGLIRHQKCFRFIKIDIRSKMAAKLQMAAISRKVHIDSEQFTLLQLIHN